MAPVIRRPVVAFLTWYALWLHAVVDVGLTLAAPGLEANPVVLALGFEAWVAVKAVLVPLAAAAWWIGRSHRLFPVAAGLAVAAALPGVANLAAFGWTATLPGALGLLAVAVPPVAACAWAVAPTASVGVPASRRDP